LSKSTPATGSPDRRRSASPCWRTWTATAAASPTIWPPPGICNWRRRRGEPVDPAARTTVAGSPAARSAPSPMAVAMVPATSTAAGTAARAAAGSASAAPARFR